MRDVNITSTKPTLSALKPINTDANFNTSLVASTPSRMTTAKPALAPVTIPATLLINGKTRKFEASITGTEASYLVYIDATTAWSVTATKATGQLAPSDWAKGSYAFKKLDQQIQSFEGKRKTDAQFMQDLNAKWQQMQVKDKKTRSKEQVVAQNPNRQQPGKANWLKQAWLGYSENAARAYVGINEFFGAKPEWVAQTTDTIARNLYYKGADIYSPAFKVGKAISNIGTGAVVAEGAIALAPESALMSIGGFLMRPAIRAGVPALNAAQMAIAAKSNDAEQITYGVAGLPLTGATLFKNIRSMGELMALVAGRNAAAKNLNILESIGTSKGEGLFKLVKMVGKMTPAEQVALDKTLKKALLDRFERDDVKGLAEVQSALNKLKGVDSKIPNIAIAPKSVLNSNQNNIESLRRQQQDAAWGSQTAGHRTFNQPEPFDTFFSGQKNNGFEPQVHIQHSNYSTTRAQSPSIFADRSAKQTINGLATPFKPEVIAKNNISPSNDFLPKTGQRNITAKGVVKPLTTSAKAAAELTPILSKFHQIKVAVKNGTKGPELSQIVKDIVQSLKSKPELNAFYKLMSSDKGIQHLFTQVSLRKTLGLLEKEKIKKSALKPFKDFIAKTPMSENAAKTLLSLAGALRADYSIKLMNYTSAFKGEKAIENAVYELDRFLHTHNSYFRYHVTETRNGTLKTAVDVDGSADAVHSVKQIKTFLDGHERHAEKHSPKLK